MSWTLLAPGLKILRSIPGNTQDSVEQVSYKQQP